MKSYEVEYLKKDVREIGRASITAKDAQIAKLKFIRWMEWNGAEDTSYSILSITEREPILTNA